MVSVGWHLVFTLLFDLSLGEKFSSVEKIIPVYYVGKSLSLKGKITLEGVSFQSVLPPFDLPNVEFIQPPLPSKKLPRMEESLDELIQITSGYRKEEGVRKNLELKPDGKKKKEPEWILPEEPVKKGKVEHPLQWIQGSREVVFYYYPPYPDWAKVEGLLSEVILKFWASPDGYIKKVGIEKSSGNVKLDLLAVDYLRRWQFTPSPEGGESVGLITVKFGAGE